LSSGLASRAAAFYDAAGVAVCPRERGARTDARERFGGAATRA